MGVCDSKGNQQSNLENNNQVLFKLKNMRDNLEKKMNNLETKEKQTKERVKQCLRLKQRDRAKFYLKGCKLYQNNMKTTEGQLTMIEDQIMNIENAQNSKDTMIALQQGNETLKKLQNEVRVEDLDKVKEDMDEMKDNYNEISDFLKERADEEVEGCEEEFEQLMQEVQNEKVSNNNVAANKNIVNNNNIQLPSIPNNGIKSGITNNASNQIRNTNINQNQILMSKA